MTDTAELSASHLTHLTQDDRNDVEQLARRILVCEEAEWYSAAEKHREKLRDDYGVRVNTAAPVPKIETADRL